MSPACRLMALRVTLRRSERGLPESRNFLGQRYPNTLPQFWGLS
jgi:hypothetical protein